VIGPTIWLALGALAIWGGVGIRRKVRRAAEERSTRLEDDDVRHIVESGRLSIEEDPPLDLEEIEEAEDDFWSEPWDEPEAW